MKKYCLFFTVILLGLTGCRTRHNAQQQTSSTTTLQSLTVENIVNQTIKSQGEFSNINISNCEALLTNNGKSFSVRVNIKIIKDKDIVISILPILGVEIFRLQLTPQRFYVFDKFNRQYCENTYENLSRELRTDISFKNLQALLTNQLFTLSGEDTISGFNIIQFAEKYILTEKQNIKNMTHQFEISPDFSVISTSLTTKSSDLVRVEYNNFDIVNKVKFPQTMILKVNFDKFKIDFELNIKKMIINDKNTEINQIDISRYSRQECTKLLPL
ncbi:MAG: DUF4292 domain-containing protein [Prevotellaceae bacterium]|jgi:hypothetical protein|nr:DUF4292 domain-containing protein [Prevotellaceae bacterium]